jgi:hypothetical protein
MTIKLAKEKLNLDAVEISFEDILSSLSENISSKVFYFDQENSHKTILDLVDVISNEGYVVHNRELKFGLANNEYMYEIHVLNRD